MERAKRVLVRTLGADHPRATTVSRNISRTRCKSLQMKLPAHTTRGKRRGGGGGAPTAEEQSAAMWNVRCPVRTSRDGSAECYGGHRFVVGCQYTVCCSTSFWTIWGGGHRFVAGCQDTVCCSTSCWTIWGGGHRFVAGCQYTVCCSTSSWTIWGGGLTLCLSWVSPLTGVW
jgi:hypothetical protein